MKEMLVLNALMRLSEHRRETNSVWCTREFPAPFARHESDVATPLALSYLKRRSFDGALTCITYKIEQISQRPKLSSLGPLGELCTYLLPVIVAVRSKYMLFLFALVI